MSKIKETLVDRAMQGWQARALVFTQGQKSQLGAILLAVTKNEPSRGPKFGPHAYILENGLIVTNMIDRNNIAHACVSVCTVGQYIHAFHGMADKLKLTDDERAAMFRLAREWIRDDYRVTKNWGKIGSTAT